MTIVIASIISMIVTAVIPSMAAGEPWNVGTCNADSRRVIGRLNGITWYGGGDDLEGHDDDKVTQTPKADNLANDLVQTGIDVLPYAIPVAIVGGVAAFIVKRRRMNA